MSTCISSAGEYSEHEPGDWCPRCGAFNEAAIVAERDRLRAWKEEALPVMSGLQELGRALGVGLGQSITARSAVDLALDLRSEAQRERERAEALERRDVTVTSTEEALQALSQWIDAGNAHRDGEAVMWGRVSKIGEEFGEVIEAVIGVTGQNPRKGTTHSWDDVIDEILDVAVTALGAVEHLAPGGRPLETLMHKIQSVAARAGVLEDEPAPRPLPRPRLRACVEAWPGCCSGEYNPACCRFPKSCSCDVYDEERVTDADLEPGDSRA